MAEMPCRLLEEHEKLCPGAKIECPNTGCNCKESRWYMSFHRVNCAYEEVACPCPQCTMRVLRKDVHDHVDAEHLGSAGAELTRVWNENARLTAKSDRLAASWESEVRHAAASSTSWVFNWKVDGGWGDEWFDSEKHDFGGGVQGCCAVENYTNIVGLIIRFDLPEETNGAHYKIQATFSVLDAADKTIIEVEIGTASTPLGLRIEPGYGRQSISQAEIFRLTTEQKTRSVRQDGSVRVRAVVHLFID
jgi:hypothetical protein